MYGRGHEQGTRKHRKPAQPWWAAEEEQTIQAIERKWEEHAAVAAVLNEMPQHMRKHEEEEEEGV